MKKILCTAKKTSVILVLLVLAQVAACAGKETLQSHKPGHHGPPPEAIEACKGHQEGDKVTFKTPHGDEISGICKKLPELLVAIPEKAPSRKDCPPQKKF